MVKVRQPGDPWWTLLTRYPRVHWWAPSAIGFPTVLLFDRYVLERSWLESLLVAATLSALGLALVWGGVVSDDAAAP